MPLLALSSWTTTSLLAHALSGLVFFVLGSWMGAVMWRHHRRRALLIETENQRLAREAAALEQDCQDLESR